MYFAFRMLLPCRLTLVVSLVWCVASHALMADWPQFRGVRNGYSEGQLPDRWNEEDYEWTVSTEVADVGSPIIEDGRVYFLSSTKTGDRVTLNCVGVNDGNAIWQHHCEHQQYRTHARNSQAASTPAADRHGVVYASADDQHTFLIAVDKDGAEVWRRDFGPWSSSHGFATSPAIHNDHVVLLMSGQAEELEPGQTPGEAYFVCVDRMTGGTKWKCPLTVTRTCYGVPVLAECGETSMWLVPHRGDGLVAINDKDGAVAWKSGKLAKRVCSSIAVSDGIVLFSEGGGSRGILYAMRFDPEHAETAAEPIYEVKRAAPYVPSVALWEDHVYRVDDTGIATVSDLATGETQFQKRLGGNYAASPVIVGDHWLTLSLEGVASVLQTKEPYGLVAQFPVGDRVSATPAISDGYLVVRVGTKVNALPLK